MMRLFALIPPYCWRQRPPSAKIISLKALRIDRLIRGNKRRKARFPELLRPTIGLMGPRGFFCDTQTADILNLDSNGGKKDLLSNLTVPYSGGEKMSLAIGRNFGIIISLSANACENL